MIPSDHFVRFYAEVFKFLEKRGPEELDAYYREISRHQELHCLEKFRTCGLQGMYDYWEHIRIEENCDMTMTLDGDSLHLAMNVCPSLSKVLDNDAPPCASYCDHCPGWVLPLMTKAGYHVVYDLVSRTEPRCDMYVFADAAKARAKRDELAKVRSLDLIPSNFD